jgi:hypothetical protein
MEEDKYYNLDSKEITREEWKKLRREIGNKIKRDIVGDFLVSTIWLGMNHAFMSDKIEIFETMVFLNFPKDIYCQRYATKEDAIKGHNKIVEMFSKKNKEEYMEIE